MSTALAPLRRCRPRLGDALFLPVLLWGWVLMALPICQGDPRLPDLAAMLAGMGLWCATAGQWLSPVFAWLFHVLARTVRAVFLPFESFFRKTEEIIKKLFAAGKKSVIMLRYILNPHQTGGSPNEKT